jgi:hypothetical protein
MSYNTISQSRLDELDLDNKAFDDSWFFLWRGSEWTVWSINDSVAIKVWNTLSSHKQMINWGIANSLVFLNWMHDKLPELRYTLPRFHGLLRDTNWRALGVLTENYGRDIYNMKEQDSRVITLKRTLEDAWFPIERFQQLEKSCFDVNWVLRFGDLDSLNWLVSKGIDKENPEYYSMEYMLGRLQVPRLVINPEMSVWIRNKISFYDELSSKFQ